MTLNSLLKRTAVCGTFAALGFAAALFFVVPNGGSAPEFYGAFAAALIAGATLILGTFYQDILKQHREERLEQRDRTAEAIDLCFWLQHCDDELEFIETTLTRIREKVVGENKTDVPLSTETFREIIKSHFFDELLERARIASRLPHEMAGLITNDLYRTFTCVDRIFALRHANEDYRPTIASLEKYIFVIGKRREKLQNGALLLETYLIKIGALPKFSKDP